MKIAYICNEYPPKPHGGIGTFVKTIAEGLVRHGHSVTVIGMAEEADDRMQNGVRVLELASVSLGRAGCYIDRRRLFGLLRKEVKAGRIEIIDVPDYHGWLPFAFGYCPVVVRLHLADTIVCKHAGRRPSRQIRWYESRTLRSDRWWAGVSQYALRQTVQSFGKEPNKAIVIYSPVCSVETGRLPEL